MIVLNQIIQGVLLGGYYALIACGLSFMFGVMRIINLAHGALAILAAYGYPANTKKPSGEFDHWYPHWMGGLDTQENIWFEPHAGKFGSFTKDKVELLLWRKVCVNKTLTIDEAKAVYLKGWTKLVPQP